MNRMKNNPNVWAVKAVISVLLVCCICDLWVESVAVFDVLTFEVSGFRRSGDADPLR